jgi:Na+/proline symporter/nitrogen-specific signal transduction histidine kinase
MISADLVLAVSLAYVAVLFGVAFLGDRRARRGKSRWLQSPLIYTLSISVYCTSWTFYGAVGSAARSGLEFVTIYLGPTLVFVGWFWLLRKLVRIGRSQRTTSIADLLSSRYGKSATLAVLVTVIAVIGTTPYIALQLKAVTTSFQIIAGEEGEGVATAFWVAAGMAVFTILFGTRNVDANERHHGVVAAIALEALVKLFALIAVGVYVTWGISGGPGAVFANVPEDFLKTDEVFGPRWIAITFLAATAIICLPRQFQVTVVENTDESHLRTASWMFPLYLFLICLFILPIAAAGLETLPAGSNPDMFVLTLPLANQQEALATLAFLGGFSSATSMVIVACIALSTMMSNHIVMPIALQMSQSRAHSSGDVRQLLLNSRRVSIVVILFLGFLYYRLTANSGALASIGLIAFAGVAQFLPSLIGGLYWRQATRMGALAGLSVGAFLWIYTLMLPSFGGAALMPLSVIENGPWGIAWLRPEAFLGLEGMDPLVHSLFWSLSLNTFLLVGASLVREPRPLEWLQSALFVDVFRTSPGEAHRFVQRSAASEDLFILAQRILGTEPARILFNEAAAEQGISSGLPDATDAFIARLERELAGSVGAASAHAMVGQAAGAETISLGELMKIADETAQLMEYSQQVEEKSRQLEQTAGQLRQANERLKALDAQKDDFLSQVSHELRTPMTSIRSFSEILLETGDLTSAQSKRFLGIVHDESLRLTRLLDEILDLNFLEQDEKDWMLKPVDAVRMLRRAVDATHGETAKAGLRVEIGEIPAQAIVYGTEDRLAQVFINLLSNAAKYNTAEAPFVRIEGAVVDGAFRFDVTDNGPGVREGEEDKIFEKFSRGWDRAEKTGTGLGLAISRQIMRRFGGDLALVPDEAGAKFRVILPLAEAARAAQ